MIEIKNLRVDYKDKRGIDDVSLTFNASELTVLAAPNGGGKSTLLRTLAGLQEKSSGEILIDGKDISGYSRTELARKIAYMPQTRNVPSIQAGRMVLHGRFPYLSYPRKYRPEDYEAARLAMERTDVSAISQSFMPELSGGQRQRVYLAMTLAQSTDIILMDEPLNFLDVQHQLEMVKLARDLAAEGKTVITVMHDIRLALQEADKLAVLDKGRLLCSGTPDEVYASGTIGKVFGVELEYAETPKGRRYYYL